MREGWVDRYPLYYLAWSKEQGDLFNLGYVDEKYFNVKVPYTQEEENQALKTMPCYTTQYTAEEIKEDQKKKKEDITNTLYFRRFVVKMGMQNGL